jgi:hypothetical protein
MTRRGQPTGPLACGLKPPRSPAWPDGFGVSAPRQVAAAYADVGGRHPTIRRDITQRDGKRKSEHVPARGGLWLPHPPLRSRADQTSRLITKHMHNRCSLALPPLAPSDVTPEPVARRTRDPATRRRTIRAGAPTGADPPLRGRQDQRLRTTQRDCTPPHSSLMSSPLLPRRACRVDWVVGCGGQPFRRGWPRRAPALGGSLGVAQAFRTFVASS